MKCAVATLLTIAATAIGGDPSKLTLAWDASPSTNVVGYTVHIAEQPGSFTNSLRTIDVPRHTSQMTNDVTNLENGKIYYFTVSAYNAVGLKSGPSNEVPWTNSYPTAPANLNVVAPIQIIININQ